MNNRRRDERHEYAGENDREVAEPGKALDICLDEIDSCRPFILGLLGNRYGRCPLRW